MVQRLRLNFQCSGPRFDPWLGNLPHAATNSSHSTTKDSACCNRILQDPVQPNKFLKYIKKIFFENKCVRWQTMIKQMLCIPGCGFGELADLL